MTPPLQGVRILEMSQAIAGPVAARTLGDLGAEVIKVEQPGVGDMSRRIGPHFLGGESAYYLNFNRNKQSVTIDLRTPQGREVFHRLVAVSDVVFDAFRPSVLERLGLDYKSLKAINPSIIACSLSAFGQEGPYRERPGFDGIVQAMGGGMSVTGNPGQPPVFMGFPVGDMVGGYVAALSIASALYGRRVTGEGRRLDISLLDVQIALQAHLGQFYLVSGEVPQPIGSGHPSNLPVGAYQCADGKYVQVHCASQEFAMKTLQMMSGEVEALWGMDEDPRFTTAPARIENRDALEEALTTGFAIKPRPEWEQLLLKYDVPGGPVNNIAEALDDPQVLLRDMVVEIDHPAAGTYRTAGWANPIKSGSQSGLADTFAPPPTLGQDGLLWAEGGDLGSQGHGHPPGKPSLQAQGVQRGVDQSGVYLPQSRTAQRVHILVCDPSHDAGCFQPSSGCGTLAATALVSTGESRLQQVPVFPAHLPGGYIHRLLLHHRPLPRAGKAQLLPDIAAQCLISPDSPLLYYARFFSTVSASGSPSSSPANPSANAASTSGWFPLIRTR